MRRSFSEISMALLRTQHTYRHGVDPQQDGASLAARRIASRFEVSILANAQHMPEQSPGDRRR